MTRLLCVIALATSCGNRPSAPAHPVDPAAKSPAGAATATATTERTQGEHGTGGVRAGGEDPCAKLIAHALAVGEAERPPDHKLTDAERTRVEAQLRADWELSCKQLTTREYDCALAAHTLAAISACGG